MIKNIFLSFIYVLFVSCGLIFISTTVEQKVDYPPLGVTLIVACMITWLFAMIGLLLYWYKKEHP